MTLSLAGFFITITNSDRTLLSAPKNKKIDQVFLWR